VVCFCMRKKIPCIRHVVRNHAHESCHGRWIAKTSVFTSNKREKCNLVLCSMAGGFQVGHLWFRMGTGRVSRWVTDPTQKLGPMGHVGWRWIKFGSTEPAPCDPSGQRGQPIILNICVVFGPLIWHSRDARRPWGAPTAWSWLSPNWSSPLHSTTT
jgi:hypothetical protein